MPTNALEDEVYHIYDTAVSVTLSKLYNLSKETGIIRIHWFQRKYKSHLFLLRIALMARDLFDVSIELEGISRWDFFLINRKIKKNFGKIYRGKVRAGGIAAPQFLEDLYSGIAEEFGAKVDFGAVYDTYYEGSLD